MSGKISIVVPVYNEGAEVVRAYDAIEAVCRELAGWEFEILFVDDGSRDDSFEHLRKICQERGHAKTIRLAANCGAHMAIRAGLEHAAGDVGCFLACDLQDPPELIPHMLAKLDGGVQIVAAVRNSRSDRWTSKLFSHFFYLLARWLVKWELPPGGASVYLLGPQALKSLRLYRERNLTLEGLFAGMGYRIAHVPYERVARAAGHSKWTLGKRLKLFGDFFVGYSYTPLRLMSLLGMLVASLGFFYASVVIFNRLWFDRSVEGWSSLMVVVLILSGTQMIMTGVMGEYLWRTLDEARARPRYIVETILEGKDKQA